MESKHKLAIQEITGKYQTKIKVTTHRTHRQDYEFFESYEKDQKLRREV